MTDTDWVGVEWIELGGGILVVAVVLALTAIGCWVAERRQLRKSVVEEKR